MRMNRCVIRGPLAVVVSSLLAAVGPSPSHAESAHGAGAGTIMGTVTIVDEAGRAKSSQSGVVVFLDEFEARPSSSAVAAAPPPPRAEVRQEGKRFLPEVLPIVVGTTVDFPNKDVVHHNVFSLSRVKPFDLGIYEQGASRSLTFDRTGLVRVHCNIHADMAANILVLANPHFAVTDENGRFSIPGVPPGKGTVRTWYSRSREHPEQRIRIEAGQVHAADRGVIPSMDFEISEDQRSSRHKNKWGLDYPEKY